MKDKLNEAKEGFQLGIDIFTPFLIKPIQIFYSIPLVFLFFDIIKGFI
jgi:hypothetical protein